MVQVRGEAGLDQGRSSGSSETETVNGPDIGFERERERESSQSDLKISARLQGQSCCV